MNAAIVDDDKNARDTLSDKLKKYEDITVVGTASDGESGLKLMTEKNPDLLFLDVEMPDMSGLNFLEKLGGYSDIHCHVIMYTSYSGYMLSSFRNNAFDFLLKPIDDKELDVAMERFYADYESNKTNNTAANFDIKQQDNNKYLFYINSSDFRLVDLKDICIFQYNHDLRVWEVIVADKKEPIRLKRNTSNDSLLKLNPKFIQVNQKYIINLMYLLEVTDNICHFYPPFDNIEYVKVGRFYRKHLIESFNSL